jgi:hypothetical protein
MLQVRQQVREVWQQHLLCDELHCLLQLLHLVSLVSEHAQPVSVGWLVDQVPCDSLAQTHSSKGGGW